MFVCLFVCFFFFSFLIFIFTLAIYCIAICLISFFIYLVCYLKCISVLTIRYLQLFTLTTAIALSIAFYFMITIIFNLTSITVDLYYIIILYNILINEFSGIHLFILTNELLSIIINVLELIYLNHF